MEQSPTGTPVDLTLHVTDSDPLQMIRTVLSGQKPPVHVEGDVQLAAEINWLVDHLRWDVEEDLSRLIGDVPAHAIADLARSVARAIREFAGLPVGGSKEGA